MRPVYLVGISVPLADFRRTLAEVPGARFVRELRPGLVVVACEDPEVALAALDGVSSVREDRLERPGT